MEDGEKRGRGQGSRWSFRCACRKGDIGKIKGDLGWWLTGGTVGLGRWKSAKVGCGRLNGQKSGARSQNPEFRKEPNGNGERIFSFKFSVFSEDPWAGVVECLMVRLKTELGWPGPPVGLGIDSSLRRAEGWNFCDSFRWCRSRSTTGYQLEPLRGSKPYASHTIERIINNLGYLGIRVFSWIERDHTSSGLSGANAGYGELMGVGGSQKKRGRKAED